AVTDERGRLAIPDAPCANSPAAPARHDETARLPHRARAAARPTRARAVLSLPQAQRRRARPGTRGGVRGGSDRAAASQLSRNRPIPTHSASHRHHYPAAEPALDLVPAPLAVVDLKSA